MLSDNRCPVCGGQIVQVVDVPCPGSTCRYEGAVWIEKGRSYRFKRIPEGTHIHQNLSVDHSCRRDDVVTRMLAD